MLLTIDNLDGTGARDYTSAVAVSRQPGGAKDAGGDAIRIERRLNLPSQLRLALVADSDSFVLPRAGARIVLQRDDGTKLFTGYVANVPEAVYSGWANAGPVHSYLVSAVSDEFVLDRKTPAARAPFVARTAGSIVKELTEELAAGAFDSAAVMDCDIVPRFVSDPEKRWSEQVGELAVCARASYRVQDSAVRFQPVGTEEHTLDEADDGFSPEGLKLRSPAHLKGRDTKGMAPPGLLLMNDITVLGKSEPRGYVKDYFLGDGVNLGFALSNQPFTRYNRAFVDEEFAGGELNASYWKTDNTAAVSVSGGKLQVSGGPVGVSFIDQIELGGALILQHGDVQFTAASSGLFGGLYSGGTDQAHAFAAFQFSPAGGQTQIAAVVNGAAAGGTIVAWAGLRYVFSTRIYASEIYRRQQRFHSSVHPAGAGRGGAEIAANAHVVMEVHVIDPNNPGTLIAPATVLYDGLLANVPSTCTYLLVNTADMHAQVAFTRLMQAVEVEVLSTIPGRATRTRLVGALSEGADCNISSRPELYFYSTSVPVANELIRACYRSSGPASARVVDPASVAAHSRGSDDGVRGGVRRVALPLPRTSTDCENAALALLDDTTQTAWSGEYETWSDFLPGGTRDVWPGDGLHLRVPSRAAEFDAVVRKVEVEVVSLAEDRSRYKLHFANDAAEPIGFGFGAANRPELQQPTATTANAGATWIADLPAAEITAITSTTVSMDAGCNPPPGGGIEVRRSDYGWGAENDRNLVGRYATRSFMVTRLTRVQTFYLRQYDAAGRYSRYSTVLHVDYPL
jgi:hypothetical protein